MAIVKVDKRGAVVLPEDMRSRAGIGGYARVRLEDSKIVIEPLGDPLREVTELVVDGPRDVEREIRGLRRAAEKLLAELE